MIFIRNVFMIKPFVPKCIIIVFYKPRFPHNNCLKIDLSQCKYSNTLKALFTIEMVPTHSTHYLFVSVKSLSPVSGTDMIHIYLAVFMLVSLCDRLSEVHLSPANDDKARRTTSEGVDRCDPSGWKLCEEGKY